MLTSTELGELRDQRWNADVARRVLRAAKASGLSMRAFCERHALSTQRLSWWKGRLDEWRERGADAKLPRLAPAVVLGGPALESAPAILRLPAGLALEVANASDVDPEWLAAVVTALSRSR